MVQTPNQWTSNNVTSPAYDFASVTPGTPITGGFKALWIGVAGNVGITNFNGTSVVFIGVPAGSILPIMGLTVITTASGTTAESIIALK